MSDFLIQIEGLDKLEKKLKNIKEVREQMGRAMFLATNTMKNKARSIVPVDTGALRRSIRNEVSYRGNIVEGIIGPTEPYGADVEFGTHPHLVSAKILEKWARKRGLNPWAVASSIKRKGTKKHPYMEPTFEQTRDKVIAFFKEFIDNLLK